MSQIDRLIYLPILFWFLLFFFGFYLLVYSFFVPLIVSTLRVRENTYFRLLHVLISSFPWMVALFPVFSSKIRNLGFWSSSSIRSFHNL